MKYFKANLISLIIVLSISCSICAIDTFAQTGHQCKGVTKKNIQCKRILSVNNKSEYCYQHLSQKKK